MERFCKAKDRRARRGGRRAKREAKAASGVRTRFLRHGLATLALGAVVLAGVIGEAAPVAWGQEQADIPLRYTALGMNPVSLYWKGKFLKKWKLGPINFELCSEGEDGNDLKCASTVMYTGNKDKNTLKSFDYCKDDTNKFALEAYQKNAYSVLKIPVIYFGEKALDNLSLHILKINKRFFSSLPLKASLIENGRRSRDSRNDLLLRPVVLHKERYAPQPVIVVCDSTGGYEGSCTSSKAARELVADYIKPGSPYWTAPPANDVHQTCKPVAGNGPLINQNMGVSSSGAGAGAAGGAPLLNKGKVRVRFVDKNGKQKDTGYGYIHILPGACTDDDTQAARGIEWGLNTMIPLPSDLHYEQKKRGKKDEAPICIVLKNPKKKKGHGAEPACRDWTYVKGGTVLQVPAGGFKPCPRGTFNFKVLVDGRPVPAGELMALLRAKGIAASQARGESDIVTIDGSERRAVAGALRQRFRSQDALRCDIGTQGTRRNPCIYRASGSSRLRTDGQEGARRRFLSLSSLRVRLEGKGFRAAYVCVPYLTIRPEDLRGQGDLSKTCEKLRGRCKLHLATDGHIFLSLYRDMDRSKRIASDRYRVPAREGVVWLGFDAVGKRRTACRLAPGENAFLSRDELMRLGAAKAGKGKAKKAKAPLIERRVLREQGATPDLPPLRKAEASAPTAPPAPSPRETNSLPVIAADDACPSDKALEAYREGPLQGKEGWQFGAKDFPDASFVLDVEQARLKRVPVRSSPVIKAEFQPFEKVEIFGYSQASREFVLVRKGGEGNEKRCGWMDTDMLVSWNTGGKIKPLRQSEAPRDADFYVAGSPINLKAVVHNLRVAGDVVPVYSKPNLKQGKIIRELKKFEFLDIFKVAPVPKSKRKYFFLVGRRAAPGRAPEILGWAHQDHITIWSTRMAAYWTGKGGIAYNWPMRHGQAMEAPKGTPDSGDQVDKKYPVLTTLPGAERLSKIVERMRNPTFDRILHRITDVRLVAPGQACAKDGSDCLSAEQFEKLAQRANENMRRLKTIDIVFLIDGTSGMDPYFKAVARGVANFVGTPGDKDARLNVSIALYGDYKGNATGPAAIDYEPIGARFDPLYETGPIDALVARAQKRQTIGDAHEDMLEAPFAAILRVLGDSTRWSPSEAGFRYLVHIADHGNREPGEARASAGGHLLTDGLDETATRADVVEMLRRRGVIYVPVAVPGRYVAAANERFELQANEILQELQTEGLAYPLAKIDSGPEDTARQVARALRDSIRIKRQSLREACSHSRLSQTDGCRH